MERLSLRARHGGAMALLLLLIALPGLAASSVGQWVRDELAPAQLQAAEVPQPAAATAAAPPAPEQQPEIVPLPSVLSQLLEPNMVMAADGGAAAGPVPEPRAPLAAQRAAAASNDSAAAPAPAPEAPLVSQPAVTAASNGNNAAPAPAQEAVLATRPVATAAAPAPAPEAALLPSPAVEQAPLYTMPAPDAANVLPPLAAPPEAEAAVPSPAVATDGAGARAGATPPQPPAAEGAGPAPPAVAGATRPTEPAPQEAAAAAPQQPSAPATPPRQGTARQGYWDNVQPDQIQNFACGIGGVSPHFQVGL